jgi:hypothetical protein
MVEKDERGNLRVAGGDVTFKDIIAENGTNYLPIITLKLTSLTLLTYFL